MTFVSTLRQLNLKRMGRIFIPDGSVAQISSHASNPFIKVSDRGEVDVFFSPRDDRNRSHVWRGALSLGENGLSLSALDSSPILAPGSTFDVDGVTMGCIHQHEGRSLLYYVGWKLEPDVPFRTQIGLAIAEQGDRDYRRFSSEPIIPRDEIDPHSFSYPFIMNSDDGEFWMYYGSATYWKDSTETQHHVIRLATSSDGIHWKKREEPVLAPEENEIAVVRPAVYRTTQGYEMYFCSRAANGPYRIVHATSVDGLNWQRDPIPLDFQTSEGEFDSEMQCYAVRAELQGREFLIYNGNSYGKTGFGAVEIL